MTFRKFFLYTLVPVFSDMVAVNCIFLLFSFTSLEEFAPLPFPLYALLGTCAVLVNCLLARRGSSIAMITAANVAMAAVSEAALFWTITGLSGWLTYATAFVCFLYPTARSLILVRNPKGPDGMLIYAELSMLGTGFFLFVQITSFDPGLAGNALCLVAAALNIGVLSSQRILHENGTEGGTGMQRGFLLAVLAGLLLAVAVAIGLLLIPSLRPLIFACINGIKALIALLIGLVVRFFIWLASLFPASAMDGEFDMPPPESFQLEEMEEMARTLPQEALIALMLLGIAAALALAVYLLARFGKIRIHGMRFRPMNIKTRSNSGALSRLLRALWRRLHRGFVYRVRLLRGWNTYPAVFVRVERRGKRLGYPKGRQETSTGYLLRLQEAVTPPDSAAEALRHLSQNLDLCCYGPSPDKSARMNRRQVRLLLKALRRKPPTVRELLLLLKKRLVGEPKKATSPKQ